MNRQATIGGLALALALGAAARAQEPADAEAGHRLALETCTACHRVAADQPQAPKLSPQAPSFVSIANGADLDAGGVYEFLRSNHKSAQTPPNMPTMVLNEREAQELTAYIASLRKTPRSGSD